VIISLLVLASARSSSTFVIRAVPDAGGAPRPRCGMGCRDICILWGARLGKDISVRRPRRARVSLPPVMCNAKTQKLSSCSFGALFRRDICRATCTVFCTQTIRQTSNLTFVFPRPRCQNPTLLSFLFQAGDISHTFATRPAFAMFDINWQGLLLPLAYLGVLVGTFMTFSRVYRRRKARMCCLAFLAPACRPQEILTASAHSRER
jgi:hypothetical protein